MNNILQMYQQLMSNPMGILQKRFNLPQNISDPQEIVQHLLNTGQISQAQVNQAMNMRNDPNIKALFGGRI